jgi:hypothetical protein
MVNMTWFKNIQKSWPLRDIKPTIINPVVLKLGQGVLHGGLQTLFFYLVDMHRLAPKMQEVMEFQIYQIVKLNWKFFLSLGTGVE